MRPKPVRLVRDSTAWASRPSLRSASRITGVRNRAEPSRGLLRRGGPDPVGRSGLKRSGLWGSVPRALTILALTVAWAAAGRAPAQGPPNEKPPSPATGKPGEPPSGVRSSPTAEDVLRALQQRRPSDEVIPPGSRAGKAAAPRDRGLLPEGASIVSRRGWLAQEDWWRFVFDPADGQPPLKLLPNAPLEQMVRTLRGAAGPVAFVVSGEVTVFQGENYFLVTLAARSAPPGDQPEAPVAPPPDAPATDASAEEVLARLQAQRPEQTGLTQDPGAEAEGGPNAGLLGRTLILDGAPLANCAGRVIRRGQWWSLTFESDRPQAPQPPLKLLPNQVVEMMVRTAERGASGLVFVVSGDVTLFEGENYLLARAATRRMDLGNLRR